MRVEILPQPEHEVTHAWEHFLGSPMQKVLHNELVKKISELRLSLEDAAAEKVPEIQMAIRAHKTFFGLIHRNEKLPTKYTYG